MARNRKRAKERRARRPEPVGGRRVERDEPPAPIGHAAPDVELAEMQMAVGRPDVEAEANGDVGEEEGLVDLGVPGVTGVTPHVEESTDETALTVGETAAPAARRASLLARVVSFLQASWRELQRVQWPDRRQVIQATGVVIGFVIVAGLFLGLSDLVSQKLMNFILK